jgi:RNA polymerase sigma-70 factor (ECF subfamily)
VRLARDGDAGAFEHLVWRYQTPLRIYLARLTGDEEQARDLAQDVFWQAWRRLRDPALFRAWLYRIATNQGRSWLRRKRLIAMVSLEWLSSEPDESSLQREPSARDLAALRAPESGFEERMADTQMVERALRRVPVDYRTALLLHVSLGFTVAEVAEQLGITPGAVRMRLCRGLAFLRASYREERA